MRILYTRILYCLISLLSQIFHHFKYTHIYNISRYVGISTPFYTFSLAGGYGVTRIVQHMTKLTILMYETDE